MLFCGGGGDDTNKIDIFSLPNDILVKIILLIHKTGTRHLLSLFDIIWPFIAGNNKMRLFVCGDMIPMVDVLFGQDLLKLNDMSIKKFINIKELDLSQGDSITDEGIQGMPLHTLNLRLNKNITNKGIKGMFLNTLDLRGNENITDEGIERMPLHTLNITWNKKITNKRIKEIKNVCIYNKA